MNDILLDDNDDLKFFNGDFTIGNSLTQEVGILLRLNQGDLKSDPILGPNLIRMINGKLDAEEIKRSIKINLARDGKDYDEIKQYIQIKGVNND